MRLFLVSKQVGPMAPTLPDISGLNVTTAPEDSVLIPDVVYLLIALNDSSDGS